MVDVEFLKQFVGPVVAFGGAEGLVFQDGKDVLANGKLAENGGFLG